MQLLIERNQSNSDWSPTFKLWAKFDLTQEEEALLVRYKMRKAIITEGNTWRDVKKSAMYSGLIMAVLAFVVAVATGRGSNPLVFLGLLLNALLIPFPIVTYLIYRKIRERIVVNDILAGRAFSCKSIIVLLEKEQHISDTAAKFRRFLEVMKTWGGREVIDIEPYAPPRNRVIEMPHAAE